MTKAAKKWDCRPVELDDVLAADYSYCILLIELIRNITPKEFQENLASIFKDVPDQSCYTRKRDDLINQFASKLLEDRPTESKSDENMQTQKGGKDFLCIDNAIFQNVRSYHQEQARERLEDQLKKLDTPTFDKKKFQVALFGWVIHFEKNDEFTRRVKDLYQKNKEVFNIDTKGQRYTDTKKAFIEQYETLQIVEDVIIPKKADSLKGKMKIVRVTSIEKGNRFYKTVCLARHTASKNEQYMFEVIRDFGNFKLKTELKKGNDALFRVRRVLQTKKCHHKDPTTFEPCQRRCMKYNPGDSGLVCKNCNHMHKQINLYKDMKHLPVLLILQRRGRLGDTFPDSFNCMDLRICYRKDVSI